MAARLVFANVATTSPLTLTFDGDAVNAVPARRDSSYSPTVGDRVRVELRTPLPPFVIGKVT